MEAQKARNRKIKSIHLGACCPFKCSTNLTRIYPHPEHLQRDELHVLNVDNTEVRVFLHADVTVVVIIINRLEGCK
jgi:hypothetical protein